MNCVCVVYLIVRFKRATSAIVGAAADVSYRRYEGVPLYKSQIIGKSNYTLLADLAIIIVIIGL